MKKKVRYPEITGIGRMIEIKKAKKKMEEMDEAMMEARMMSGCKMSFGRKK